MKRISITPVAWIALLWALSFVLTVLSIILLYQIKFVLNADTYIDFWLELTLAAVVGPGLGWAIIYGDPHQSIAWIFCTLGFLAGVHHFCAEYATYTTLLEGGSLPGGTVMAGIASWIWVPMFGLFVFLCMLFPLGELPRPTSLWRWFVWSTAIVVLGATVLVAFTATYVNGLPSIPNPLALDGVTSLVGVDTVYLVRALLFVFAFIALGPLFVRWYYARRKERPQVHGFLCAASVTVMGVVLKFAIFQEYWPQAELLYWLGSLIDFLGIVAIPAAIIIAVRKYGLYDGINRVINRTLVYSSLMVIVWLVYCFAHAVCVFLIEGEVVAPLTGTFNEGELLGSLFSTMIVVAILDPLRKRVETFVHRYYPKYEAEDKLQHQLV